MGPAAIVNAHRFIFDSRDDAADERLEILNDREGVWRCCTIFNCTEAGPAAATTRIQGRVTMGEFFNESKSHWTGGPIGGDGHDDFTFDIPAGERLVSVRVEETDTSSGHAGARLESSSAANTEGAANARVRWWYEAFSAIRYKVIAVSEVKPVVQPGQTFEECMSFRSDVQRHSGGFFGSRGGDKIKIALPSGFSFRDVVLVIRNRSRSSGFGARITSRPALGASGELSFDVRWWCSWFHRIIYEIVVNACRSNVCAEVRTLTFSPDPGTAGSPVTASATIFNCGSINITRVRTEVTAVVEHADADVTNRWDGTTVISQVFTDNVDIAPQASADISHSIDIPGQILSFRPAGLYTIMLVGFANGVRVFENVREHFRVN